jgi:hypothetical protein
MPETPEALVDILLKEAKKAISYCWDRDIQLVKLMQAVAKIERTYKYEEANNA